MPVRMNRMKQKLRQGQSVFGGLLRTPEPTLVEVLGYAGYDYVVLDAEHGAHSFEALDTLMAMAARKGIPVSLSVRGVEEVRDALKKGPRLASVGTLETVLYQALRAWHQNVTK